MPVYEYQCDSCHHRFEKRQGFNDEPVAECPECQAPVRRVFHPAPVIFKGGGFYVTDSRGESGAAESASAVADAPAGEAKSAGTETPAASGEAKEAEV